MKDDKIYLNHILDAINEIEVFVKDGFDAEDIRTERAIERCLEIIGEAANKLSKNFQKKFNQIEWNLVIGMRNKIIHDYFNVDLYVIKSTVEDDLPILKKQILKILKEIKKQS